MRVEYLQLGAGYGRTKGNRSVVLGSQLKHFINNTGARGSVAGRKNHFDECWQLVEVYTDCERLSGSHLEMDDVYRECMDQVEKRMMVINSKRKFAELTTGEAYKYSLMEER